MPRKGEINFARLKDAYAAYVRFGNLTEAGQSLRPPSKAESLRQMLYKGQRLGLFRNPYKPNYKRPLTDQRIARLHAVKQLYDKTKSLEATGRAMRPPLSGSRVGDLLRQGAELGLYAYAPRRKSRFSLQTVRKAIIEIGSVEAAARLLGTYPQRIRDDYRPALKNLAKIRLRKRQEKALALYLSVAKKLGYDPKPSQKLIGADLYRRIVRAFGGTSAFHNYLKTKRSIGNL